MRGIVLWEGPSRLDGAPTVAVMTLRSANRKTGDMPQVWILRADVAPGAAYRSGQDTTVCGDCPLRSVASNGNGACYVQVDRAPGSVWRTWQAGRYEPYWEMDTRRAVEGRTVRIGAYGDPAAVPVEVWARLARLVGPGGSVLGYTHQWRRGDSQTYARYCMASVESEDDAYAARARGWRTFRVRRPGGFLMSGEIVCPASADRGHITDCARCGLCAGTSHRSTRSVAITVHGPTAGRF